MVFKLGVKIPKFSVGTHSITSNIIQPSDDQPYVYFEDRTDNHNKTMVSVRHLPAGVLVDVVVDGEVVEEVVVNESIMTVTITTRNGSPIVKTVPQNRFLSIQAEDVTEVAITCAPENQNQGEEFDCFGEIKIEKTFCIYC